MLWVCKESCQVLKRDCSVGRKFKSRASKRRGGKANWGRIIKIKWIISETLKIHGGASFADRF